MLNNPESCKRFIEKDFDRAMEVLKDVIPQKSDKLYILIDDMIKRLGGVSLNDIIELKNKDSKKRKLIFALQKKLNEIISGIEK